MDNPAFTVTFFNYRCFSDSAPARLEVLPGFASIIGSNNAGKSTVLRSFYELRTMYSLLANVSALRALQNGEEQPSNILGVGDQEEIFYNAGVGPCRIEIRLSVATEDELSGVDFHLNRRKNSFKASFRGGPRYEHVQFANNSAPNGSIRGIQRAFRDNQLIELGIFLSNAMYLPATRIAVGAIEGSVYDLSFGSGFIGQWDIWKTGTARAQNDAIEHLTEDVRKLFRFSKLEITATPDNRDLHVVVDRKTFKLRELGGGLAQFVIALANIAIKRPSMVLIDEPEIGLHPSMQLDFLTTIGSYTQGPVLFSTHSLGLARVADSVWTVRRVEGKSVLSRFEDTPTFAQFMGELSFAAYKELGFDSVLLVEGVNDIKTVQQFLRCLDKDHRVIVMQLGGSQMITGHRAQELAEILRLTSNVFALIDSEKTSESEPLSDARRKFLENCAAMHIRAHATTRRALEHYMSDQAVKAAFGPKFSALPTYGDRSSIPVVWAKADSWRAAREMTKDELLATDLGQYLNMI